MSVAVHPKVQAGGAAGALTVVLVSGASALGLDLPPEVASAITVLFAAVAGYLTPAKAA